MFSRLSKAAPARLAACAFALALLTIPIASAEDGHGEAEAGHDDEAAKPLTAEQMAEAGIVVEPATLKPLPRLFGAPGEVRINDYTSSIVSPRIGGSAVKRHVVLGARVRAGDPLLRLFSTGMAEAQSAFVLAHQDYARLTGAGRDAVARKAIDEARVALQEARVRLMNYGLTAADLAALERGGLAGGEIGTFDLRSPQDGIVVSEDVRIGEVVEAGKPVLEIGDGRTVWVEARVSPAIASLIEGDSAAILDRDLRFEGRILNIFPKLDEQTRTVAVRIEVVADESQLRPGTFVDVQLYGAATPVIAVPTAAVLRGADGDWTVYVEHEPGVFEPAEVEILYAVGDLTAIDGIAEGTRIVTGGAFFIAAEAAKSGFDAHAH